MIDCKLDEGTKIGFAESTDGVNVSTRAIVSESKQRQVNSFFGEGGRVSGSSSREGSLKDVKQ